MSHQPPHWTDHLASIAAALGFVWGVVHGGFVMVRRWWRTRRAQAHAVRVVLDVMKQQLAMAPDGEDASDALARRATWYEQIREARQRLWLAQGRKPGAPSRTPTPSESEPDE